ncbi:aminopeptidase [Asaia krungthepensis NRIC 0535]|uniref:Aminopeptidase n=2 Tax=Asaia krungthepensis TaxID=220990 RepID=A0ABQ0Q023_9PROT|nr:aminopeptidase [Asaia krungthepensis NRIC 0535]
MRSARFSAAAFLIGMGLFASPSKAAEPLVYAPMNPARMSDVIRTLASDPFEGRAPGTIGAIRSVNYIVSQFQAIGLEPAGDNGTWTQEVPMIHTKVAPDALAHFRIGASDGLDFHQSEQIYLTTSTPSSQIRIADAPLVFVGYGVTAPGRDWDDFKNVDLKGKIAVILINDPDFRAEPGEPVAGRFGGRTMTYYGRWTYKYEEAARRGAIGALIIHDTAAASYPWSTVIAPGGETFDLDRKGKSESLVMRGWIEGQAAHELFARSGLDLDRLSQQARRPDFSPVTLPGVTLTTSIDVNTTRLQSRNVLAKLPGTTHPDETIVYGAHWDAFGKSKGPHGEAMIRRGAIDDASGIAAVLEIARAFKSGPAPERTILFGAWTAEERGLLGSTWYVEHPLVSLPKTVANFTIDVLQMGGMAHNAFLVGAGQDSLQDDFATIASSQGRVTVNEALPERGAFYRADHLPFARAGVPVLPIMDLAGYPDLLQGGVPAGRKWLEAYMACYHQPCDAWSASWDLRGAAEDAAALYEVGRSLAFSRMWPSWKQGSEFKALRERTDSERPAL